MREAFLKIGKGLIKSALILALVCALLVGLPILAFVGFHIANEKCEVKTVGTSDSPNGQWKLVRVQKFCTSDEAVPPEQFALLKPGQTFSKSSVFFVGSSDPDFDHHTILGKWQDASNILISSPASYDFKAAPKEFNGINIHYDVYSHSPEIARNTQSHHVINKPITLQFRLEKNDGIGQPGLGCDLWAEGNDGDYLGKLSLRLSSSKVFAAKAWKGAQLVPTPEFESSGALITADKEIKKTTSYVTSAQVENFSLDHREGWERDDNYNHAWQLLNRIEPTDIQTAITKLKAGGLKIKVGFWLDNIEVIYTSVPTKDLKPIQDFEQCLAVQKNSTH
ncbi:hypothetical protein GGD83_000284 [Rhodoblastus sphagnicola]|uniref:hypothetical protein n=1 Tax=Rhodoblastus sphagnicola TaxID=333368 RepID=UPI0011B0521D|nr:hypothetical protein [Rhodoblastus sphagnicola]MBB4196513.1 hypothetical protein [Rhodoblastus sphagnicola]